MFVRTHETKRADAATGCLLIRTIAIQLKSHTKECFMDKIHMFAHERASVHNARPNTGQTERAIRSSRNQSTASEKKVSHQKPGS